MNMKKIVRKVAALMIAAAVGITSPAIIYAEGTIGTVQTQDNQSEDSTEIDNPENKDTTEKDVTDKNTENPADTEEKTDDSEQTDVTDKDSNVENPDGSDTQDEIKPDDTDESQDTENPDAEEPAEEKELDATYEVHMQNIGWMDARTNGETAGNDEGTNHMEAIRIQVPQDEEQKLTGSIVYRAHVSDIGWQNEVADGALAGTTGKNKAVEALKIRLTDELAEKYDVYYRVCSEKKGWFGWAKNGELAGSVGFGYGIKAIQIKLYAKDSQEKPEQNEKASLTENNMGDVIYQAYVHGNGWQKKVIDGAEAGTTGKSKQLEAFRIQLSDDLGENGSIVYAAHVANVGWQDWVQDGALAGTTGTNNAVEAMRIKLTGEVAEKYDVYYRAHISNFGWLEWTQNGQTAGSVGYSLPVEAFQIKVVAKDSADKPATGERCYLSEELIPPILYAAHVSDIGWQNWVRDGEIAGTTGQNKKMEAIQIRLTGEKAKYSDIYYRTHVANIGWLGWAKNGEIAGSTGFSYGMEAIQIVVVPKGKAAPGSTADHYREKKFTEMELRANLYSSATPYLLLVNRSRHKVYIFQGYRGNWKQIREWSCGDGAASTPTVEGTFKVQNRGYYFDSGSARCYWWTQFYGNYLFHSVLYHKDGTLMDGRVGMALSHGCVRLEIQNAKWIYDTIPSGSTVVVYH